MTTKRSSRAAAKAAPSLRLQILVVHGPNLNLLGSREPKHYGRVTLEEIDRSLVSRAEAAGALVETFQHNHEGALIDRIHQAARDRVDFIIINPAAYTHTSVALRDALAASAIPFIEIHLSNIFAREAFRQHSYFSDLAIGVISGLGAQGYELALEHALRHFQDRTPQWISEN
ncbi:3-dehydroquinate dehydratase [Thiobacillus denitrificans ATCC 25259]|uniref:3-dehydroquinate dehydratase n=1 Tax=Thiobacillus denitrificans (strain ATCC 25259 / T1) TaxID=292415 RepID=Q3SMB1_THIDA|nr:type II 3-dehydroquinate dehydratase [Thiobacillus denitrificans]AAZ96136.1 3-dehydroquinate dehydratase [Thiobacillus denitrificans ATCC 25259]